MNRPDFIAQATRIVTTNDQADLHARLAGIEHYLEHGEYAQPWQIDVWANDFRDEHERAIEGLAKVLEADYEFKVLTDSFSEGEYGGLDEIRSDQEMTIDEYCEVCHDAPDGCDSCQD